MVAKIALAGIPPEMLAHLKCSLFSLLSLQGTGQRLITWLPWLSNKEDAEKQGGLGMWGMKLLGGYHFPHSHLSSSLISSTAVFKDPSFLKPHWMCRLLSDR